MKKIVIVLPIQTLKSVIEVLKSAIDLQIKIKHMFLKMLFKKIKEHITKLKVKVIVNKACQAQINKMMLKIVQLPKRKIINQI